MGKETGGNGRVRADNNNVEVCFGYALMDTSVWKECGETW